jgi:hypothetical protein
MSDSEIAEFFNNKITHTCGRFSLDQFKIYTLKASPKINPGLALFKAGLLSLLLVLVNRYQSSAQSISIKPKPEIVQPRFHKEKNSDNVAASVVKGVVKSEDDKQPIPGVNIVLKGSSEGTLSNVNGEFVFPIKLLAGDVLVFDFVGFDTKEYVVPKSTKDIVEIRMDLAYCMMLGEVAVTEIYSPKQSSLQKFWARIKGVF